ncbi:epidermal growth factor-like protein 8 isoform X4 [Nematostella vectensis]|uniref:epidermal growth factor-like protein 8 isoform X3 n=1 Tax=Nematostella vectensis TaxID=45351 RepID=UPI00138FC794|nr:epidermal growth factor-like protein 8 isoform X3 [Nematostella vectensis]XP_048587696.1 epidermal growth factor-like protein 8 isoform X4 [Nematostella vectensis]
MLSRPLDANHLMHLLQRVNSVRITQTLNAKRERGNPRVKMGALVSNVSFLLGSLLAFCCLWDALSETRGIPGPGLNVCVKKKTDTRVFYEFRPYSKAVYKPFLHRCAFNPFKLCSSYRTLFQLAHKKVKKTEVLTRTYYDCCAGWLRHLDHSHCTIPICDPPCLNGGRCKAPNTCACLPGWTGNDCSQQAACEDCGDRWIAAVDARLQILEKKLKLRKALPTRRRPDQEKDHAPGARAEASVERLITTRAERGS